MLTRTGLAITAIAAILGSGAHAATTTPHWTVLGWNDLGMHCMDSDYSVFSILPPLNNVRAQVIDAATMRRQSPVPASALRSGPT